MHTLLHIEGDPMAEGLISAIIAKWPDVQHLGVARTGLEGLALSAAFKPKIVLLDLELPDACGFEIAAQLAKLARPPQVLLITAKTDDVTLYRLSESPVRGMVLKSPSVYSHLRLAIDSIDAGKRFFPQELRDAQRRFRSDANAFFKVLSKQEIVLLPMLGRGDSDLAIASHTGLSSSTIHSHRQRIMGKLGLHRRHEFMQWAWRKGFVAGFGSTPAGSS